MSRDPVTHAAVWNEELARDPERYAETLDRWIDYAELLGAHGIAEGAVVLRRRAGRNWFRADRIPAERQAPSGEHVLRVFAAHDYLSELDDESRLLDEPVRLVDTVRVEQELVCRDGGYVVESMTLVLEEGLGFRAGVDQNAASLIPLLDGRRPLHEAIARAARSRGLDDEDAQAFSSGALGIVRTMLELGLLTRTGETEPEPLPDGDPRHTVE